MHALSSGPAPIKLRPWHFLGPFLSVGRWDIEGQRRKGLARGTWWVLGRAGQRPRSHSSRGWWWGSFSLQHPAFWAASAITLARQERSLVLAAVGAEGTQAPGAGPGALSLCPRLFWATACPERPKSGSKTGVLLAVDCSSASGLAQAS